MTDRGSADLSRVSAKLFTPQPGEACCRATAGTVPTCQVEEVALRPEWVVHITVSVYMVAPLQKFGGSGLSQQGALGAGASWLERL